MGLVGGHYAPQGPDAPAAPKDEGELFDMVRLEERWGLAHHQRHRHGDDRGKNRRYCVAPLKATNSHYNVKVFRGSEQYIGVAVAVATQAGYPCYSIF